MYMHIGACITLVMPGGEHVRWLCKAVEAETEDGTSINSRDDLIQLLRENTPQVKSIAFVPEGLIPLLRAALRGDDAAADEYAGLTEDM
ncbi:hypothetical protein [Bifidobacterium felsineum]|uniref:Uncharacterized protein n=1 Tax=Bifidobacterium felsineum TaxID=2045440 RepID=A0A2M9HLF2_9BIFI|nr:hypothetical protein [Bifidobacterium felsineum]MBT1163128.1 hypothetical protein [Bifidobacterium felsineum]PJM77619.1 hypothetical protein CSQ86_00580 [Bifidobacterium felsineum]